MRTPHDWAKDLLQCARTNPSVLHLIVAQLQSEAVAHGFEKGMDNACNIASSRLQRRQPPRTMMQLARSK